MKPDRCSFCKGKLVEGKTEFVAKVGEQIIAIKDVSASRVSLREHEVRFTRYAPSSGLTYG